MRIRIGTRKSKLALEQTQIALEHIKKHMPQLECVIVPIITSGDKIQDKNLYDIGGKALFLKELEEQLLNNKIDLAVHSLKDVPGIVEEGLEIVAVFERDDPRDCFVSYKYKSIADLPEGAVIGTSSVRRKIILQNIRPDLRFTEFRGNVNTRLQKIKSGNVDATILAMAGLKRLGLFDESFCKPIKESEMLPAAGQGMIALQIRKDDSDLSELCKRINHHESWFLSLAERGFLGYLDASCRTPMAACAQYDNDGNIIANYMLADDDGSDVRYTKKECALEDAHHIGILAAKELKGG